MDDTKPYHGLVPPSGVEPELPKELDFESSASTNSAKGASEHGMYQGAKKPASKSLVQAQLDNLMASLQQRTVPHDTQLEPSPIQTEVFNLPTCEDGFADCLYEIQQDLELPMGMTPDFYKDSRGYYYLQIRCVEGTCNVTDEPMEWTGRKWLLSEFMTYGEVVQTVLKATLTAIEHEVRERFLYKGKAIFDPHYDLDKLVHLRGHRDAIKGRA